MNKTIKRPGRIILKSELLKSAGKGKPMDIIHSEEETHEVSDDNSASFKPHCPRVGGEVSMTIGMPNYSGVRVGAWVELPCPEFTKSSVLAVQERAFQLAQDKVVEKAPEMAQLLKDLLG